MNFAKNRDAREWASKHAYLLIFLSAMFVITWVVEVFTNYIFR